MTFLVAGAIIGGVASVGGALIGSRAAGKASTAAREGSQREIEYAKEAAEIQRTDEQPYREAGYTGLNALMGLAGLDAPASVSSAAATGSPTGGNVGERAQNVSDIYRMVYGREADPEGLANWEGIYDRLKGDGYSDNDALEFIASRFREAPEYEKRREAGTLPGQSGVAGGEVGSSGSAASPAKTPLEMLQADPGYNIRLDEGQRTRERGASARGGLLAGGTGRALERYAQDYASNEYTAMYNRISNIAGLGQVSTGRTGAGALAFGQQAGSAVRNATDTRASGYVAQGNQWANAGNQIAKAAGSVDWGSIFNSGGSTSSGPWDHMDPTTGRSY